MTLVVFSFIGAYAQSEYNVSAQYVRVNPEVRQPKFRYDNETDSIGALASATKYYNANVGITGEVGAAFRDGHQESQLYSALGGVTLKSRHFTSVQPFVKGAAGFVALKVGDSAFGKAQTDYAQAYKLSTGIDYGVGRVKFRVIEVGYLNTRLFHQSQNNLVLSTGVTF